MGRLFSVYSLAKSIRFQSPVLFKKRQIDSAKVQRWGFVLLGLFGVPFILQASIVRGEGHALFRCGCSYFPWLQHHEY